MMSAKVKNEILKLEKSKIDQPQTKYLVSKALVTF